MLITSKTVNYRLYQGGAYGNKLRTWNYPDEIVADRYFGPLIMRYKGLQPGVLFPRYGTPIKDVAEARALSEIWVTQFKADQSLIQFNELAPDERLVIQGELQEVEGLGYTFMYSTEKTQMRKAMEKAKHHVGPAALTIAKSFMTPSSAEDIDELMLRYSGAVVEFSAYSMCLGSCRGRNTIVWEVRHF